MNFSSSVNLVVVAKALLAVQKEIQPVVEQPYNLDVEEAPAKPAGRGAAKNVRPPVKKGKY